MSHMSPLIWVTAFGLENLKKAQAAAYVGQRCQNNIGCGWPESGLTCDLFGSNNKCVNGCNDNFDCGWPHSDLNCDVFGSKKCVNDQFGTDHDTINSVSIVMVVIVIVFIITIPACIGVCICCIIRARNRSRQQSGTIYIHGAQQLTPVGPQYGQTHAPYVQNPSPIPPQQINANMSPQQFAPVVPQYAQPPVSSVAPYAQNTSPLPPPYTQTSAPPAPPYPQQFTPYAQGPSELPSPCPQESDTSAPTYYSNISPAPPLKPYEPCVASWEKYQ